MNMYFCQLFRLGVIATLLQLMVPIGVSGQKVIQPELLTIEDGLAQGHVSTIIQDKEGFLWFGTKNGLNRYDGENFELFTVEPGNPYSISQDWINMLFEYGDFILVGGIDGNLDIYSKRNRRFYQVPKIRKEFQHAQSAPDILMDSTGQIWIHSGNMGKLLKLSFPEGFWDYPDIDSSLLNKIEYTLMPGYYTEFVGVKEDGSGLIMVGRNFNLFHIEHDGTVEKLNISLTHNMQREGTVRRIDDKIVVFRAPLLTRILIFNCS